MLRKNEVLVDAWDTALPKKVSQLSLAANKPIPSRVPDATHKTRSVIHFPVHFNSGMLNKAGCAAVVPVRSEGAHV